MWFRSSQEIILLQNRLRRGGQIGVPLLDFRAGLPRLPERFPHLVREHRADRGLAIVPRHRDSLAVMQEVVEVQPDLVFFGADQFARLLGKSRLAVRGEAHHLVFVAVLGEAQKLRERRVEQSQRMRETERRP